MLVVEGDRPGTGPVVQALRGELALPVLLAWDPARSQPPADAVLAGAQPVLRLPLELDDVLARLGEAGPTRAPGGSVLSAGALVVDTGADEATLGGVALGLARREMDVLVALVQSPGRVVPRERLCRLWPPTPDQDGNLVATVARLRRHFAHVGACDVIATVRGSATGWTSRRSSPQSRPGRRESPVTHSSLLTAGSPRRRTTAARPRGPAALPLRPS